MKEITHSPSDSSFRLVSFGAAGVWLLSLLVYNLTVAPTLSFWDCGEFIAASSILGIPHPPGSPLYVLIGRIFSILPLDADPAVRVNLLSVVSSAFTAMFLFLAAERCLRWLIPANGISSALRLGGAACGAFFAAFSITNWNNSVEAEVYGLSMAIFAAILWLSFVYWDRKDSPGSLRFVLLITFLAFLGIAVHMTTFLILPIAAILIIVRKNAGPAVWLSFGALLLTELFLIFALSSRVDEVPYFVPVVVSAILFLFYVFSQDRIPGVLLAVAGALLVSCLPLIGLLARLISGGEGPNSQTLVSIGQGLFGVTVLFGFYLLYRSTKERSDSLRLAQRVAFGFIVAAAAGVLVLEFVRGYSAFLIISAMLVGGVLLIFRRHIDWPAVLALGAGSAVILGIEEYVWASAVALAMAGILLALRNRVGVQPGLKIIAIIVAAAIGFSVHLFVPIRSAQHPRLNENNPSQDITSTVNFLERKQYGSQSMVERMFERRAEWENQFGNFRRIGLWGYLSEQYGVTGSRFVLLFLPSLLGLWELVRKKPAPGVFLICLTLVASVGLVLYMNFADGTRQHPVTGGDYLEVRERDYFFTPAYLLVGMAIGVGLACLIQALHDSMLKMGSALAGLTTTAAMVLFLTPGYALAANWHHADRTDNYIPYDYGWNLFVGCEPNAVLFTAGDNDTFTLWCLQETYNVRRDIAVVNLSLANTKWYIKQLEPYLDVDLSWTDSDIDSLRPFRDQDGHVHFLKNQVVAEIIKQNFDRRPIYFSVTVQPDERHFFGQSLDTLLELHGMAWKVTRTGGGPRMNLEKNLGLLSGGDGMKFRQLNNPAVYMTETDVHLTRNYGKRVVQIAEVLMRENRFDEAVRILEECIDQIPYAEDAMRYLAILYTQRGMSAQLDSLAQRTGTANAGWMTSLKAQLAGSQGDSALAESLWLDQLVREPSNREVFDKLLRLYYQTQDVGALHQLLQQWVQFNPVDSQARKLLDGIDAELRRQELPERMDS